MASIERRFCSLEEHRYFEGEAVDEELIAVNGIYTVRFAFEPGQREEAIVLPGRVTQKEVLAGGANIFFDMYLEDGRYEFSQRGFFRNGFWQREASSGIIFHGMAVNEGFFVDNMDKSVEFGETAIRFEPITQPDPSEVRRRVVSSGSSYTRPAPPRT